MEHHRWGSISAPPHGEACFSFELGCEEIMLTMHAHHVLDSKPGSRGYGPGTLSYPAIPSRFQLVSATESKWSLKLQLLFTRPL